MYINEMTIDDIKSLLLKIEEKPFRAKQIYRQIHKNKVNDFDLMTDLSKDLRSKLKDIASFPKMEYLKTYKSKIDSTEKYLFELDDDNIIEAVYMQYDNRSTVCISTQVGCKMGCKFCASTKNGFVRNLSAAEILEEVYTIERNKGDINNIVIMGIGEPLDNYDNLVKFINIITDEQGRNLSHRSITVSTVGLVDRIYDLANSNLDINLAVSLHYSNDKKREKFMPSAKRYKINDIIKATDYYLDKTKRRVSFEYVVIDNVNNTKEDVEELKNLFFGKNVHLNLLRLNSIEEFKYDKPKENTVKDFCDKLTRNGLNATIRKPMGSDIDASCGQLRNNYKR